jgi:hypothetical protein
MAVVVRGQGGLMVRVEPGAAVTEMRGSVMGGCITVSPSACTQAPDLRRWVKRGYYC